MQIAMRSGLNLLFIRTADREINTLKGNVRGPSSSLETRDLSGLDAQKPAWRFFSPGRANPIYHPIQVCLDGFIICRPARSFTRDI